MAYNQIFSTAENSMSYSLELPLTPRTPKEAKSLSVITIDEDGRVVLGLGTHPTSARAEKVLLDKVTLNLITTIGTSNFDPSMGSFLNVLQRSNIKDVTAIKSKLTLALSAVNDKIKKEQVGQALNPGQQLLDLKLSDVFQDPLDPTNLLVEVIVVTVSNESYILTV